MSGISRDSGSQAGRRLRAAYDPERTFWVPALWTRFGPATIPNQRERRPEDRVGVGKHDLGASFVNKTRPIEK